ncbi:MAG TPA: TolC family protein [Polyangiaceae bacterium]
MRRAYICFATFALSFRVTAASGQSGNPAQPVPFPAPLTENDPMLDPIAAAPHMVAGWEQALAQLRARSTDLRIALDEVERSEGQWREALAASLPTVTGTGNVTANLLRNELTFCNPLTGVCTTATLPDAYTYGAAISLNQPLFAPRAWHTARTANLATEVARLSAEDQKRLLTLALANAVVAVVTAERISEINRVGLRAALDRAALARRRLTLGAGNALDTVRADQDVAVARAAVVTGDESLRQARETLGLALGSTEPWGVPRDINLNGVEASARASCDRAATLEERADIAAARGTAAVAQRNVDDVWLQFSPTVNLVSTYSATSTQLSNGLHQAWTIQGVLTVPLFDGGFRYGALRETRAQADAAGQRLESARRAATVQIAQARRAIDVADESRRVAERARDLARETERLARVAFQAGTGTSLDLIESGRRLREAESQLALQEFGLVRARIGALLALSRCHW